VQRGLGFSDECGEAKKKSELKFMYDVNGLGVFFFEKHIPFRSHMKKLVPKYL
jgi:carboxypeptidase C (cathepsin A)